MLKGAESISVEILLDLYIYYGINVKVLMNGIMELMIVDIIQENKKQNKKKCVLLKKLI